jgi:rubrerythrin
MQTLTRAGLLRSGAGAALAVSGAGLVARAAAADVPPDADLAYARLLVAADLLAADFYAQALAAKQFGAPAVKELKRAAFNEQEHYAAVAGVLTAAGQTPATADDIDFSYPAKAFAEKGSIAKLGVAIEQLQLGAYLGAADAVQTEPLRGIATRIAANEAQHVSLFTGLLEDRLLGVSLPLPLAIGDASNALGAYTS